MLMCFIGKQNFPLTKVYLQRMVSPTYLYALNGTRKECTSEDCESLLLNLSNQSFPSSSEQKFRSSIFSSSARPFFLIYEPVKQIL
jgi:hypothetical protein